MGGIVVVGFSGTFVFVFLKDYMFLFVLGYMSPDPVRKPEHFWNGILS